MKRSRPRPVELPDESQVPHSPEAERAVLGSILVGGADAFRKAAAMLTPEDFFDERNRLVFRAMISIHSRGAVIDPVTLREALREQTE